MRDACPRADRMKGGSMVPSRDWFAFAVRLLGLVVLYRAVDDSLHLGSTILGLNPESITKQWDSVHSNIMYDLWFAGGFLAVALYLLLGAEHLTRCVYGEPSQASDEVADDSA